MQPFKNQHQIVIKYIFTGMSLGSDILQQMKLRPTSQTINLS